MFKSAVLAINLLINWRLSQNNLPAFIHNKYGSNIKKIFWNYGNSLQKLRKAELDIDFLNKCKTYNVIPKFLKFKLYRKDLMKSHHYQSYQNKLLNNEIECRKRTVRRLTDVVSRYLQELHSSITTFHYVLCQRFFRLKNKQFSVKYKDIHTKKLKDLGIYNNLDPCNPDNVIFNFSSINLSPRLRTLLAFGLDFNLPIYKLNFFSYFLKFEQFFNDISYNNVIDFENRTEFKLKLKSIACRYFYSFKPYKVFSAIFSRKDFSLLKELGNNKSIIVTKPDKGRGVVLVDKNVYLDKMQNLISDPTKFQLINDPINVFSLKIEDKINNFLRKLKKLSLLSDDVYKQLFVSGSGPGILYGLPKVHKPNFSIDFPFRPIFAAYNTAAYKLSKFLVPILAPITINEYTSENSYTFCKSLHSITNPANSYMASFDIENLFTNIPLKETIDICINKLFVESDTTILGLNKSFFKTLLEYCVLNSSFIFNSKLYKQIEGLGMGLPLGPTFANIFMCHYETKWLNDCPSSFRPLFYKRYIDDTFLLFSDESHCVQFFDYLNSKHDNIKFTMECERAGCLSFLDVNITRDGNNFNTGVFRKNTFTGLGLSYFSYCNNVFKINSIKCLLHRAYNICSTYKLLHLEFDFLVQFFKNNGYPLPLIYSHIKKFLTNKFDNSNNIVCSSPIKYVSLPYFGPPSIKMKDDILKLLAKLCPSVKFRIILINSFNINSFFRYKDSLPTLFRSSVVYQYKCATCGAGYVGSTYRPLYVRASEHRGLSFRTQLPLSTPSHSSIRNHSVNTHNSLPNVDDFTIIGSNNHPISLRILESLYISKFKPSLNDSNSAFPLHIVQ